MKKFIAIIAITATVVAFAAEQYRFPGWDKDVSVYEAAIARYEAAKEGEKPFSAYIYSNCKLAKALVGVEIKSFDDIYNASKRAFDKEEHAVHYAVSRAIGMFQADKTSALAKSVLRGAYDACHNINSAKCGIIAANATMRNAIGVTDSAALAAIINALGIIPSKDYSSATTLLNALYELLPDSTMPEAEQLAFLKKLNRRFSKELLERNKDKWEPIIAKLRTVIASY